MPLLRAWIRRALPNGTIVSCFDKLTAFYVYDEIFKNEVYTRQGGIEVHPGDVVFDVGANIGLFTMYVAEKARNVEIHAFEPVYPIFEALGANVAELEAKVEIYNIGLGEEEGDIDFQFYPRVCADSTATPFDFDAKVARYVETYDQSIAKDIPIARIVPKAWRPRVVHSFLKRLYTGRTITCHIRTLSDVIAEQHVTRIDLLKVDAENAERQVVAGMKDADWAKVRQVSMEVHTHIKGGENLVAEMQDLLRAKGFQVSLGKASRETIMGVFMVYGKK
jgi:FkbM family methyltransferase